MAQNAMSAKALQLFRGGLNDVSLNPWVQNLGGECCNPAIPVVQDRLNPTINAENALVHTAPAAHKDYWHFRDLADSRRQKVVDHLNAQGVGGQLEVLLVPTFAFLTALHVVVMAEETGFTFDVVTRNGVTLPATVIKVTETDAANGCGAVGRVQAVGAWTNVGALGGGHRVHLVGQNAAGTGFSLDSDVLILQAKTLPAGGVKGYFDVAVYATYDNVGRSEASR